MENLHFSRFLWLRRKFRQKTKTGCEHFAMKCITIRCDICFENIGPKSARKLTKKFVLHLYGSNY